MENPVKRSNGFILIEIIVSTILLGIIGIFTSMFLYTATKGYLISKQTTDGAMKAQIALDRINLELRRVNAVPNFTQDTCITYTTDDLPGTRKIIYDSNAHTISIDVNGNANVLLDQISTFNLSYKGANLDTSDGDSEIAGIIIEFTMTDIGRPFKIQIYPRSNWIDLPSSGC
ncbi:MAG: hypothetical protein JSV31_15820 [Desulfobacterales bacterium]|nr:MAG: hypothetical protein JSV31_15820 [Desulfobacterales bacterium]